MYNITEITESLLSSIATTTTTTPIALTGKQSPYSIPTAFITPTVCGSLSNTINTKIRKKNYKVFTNVYFK